MEVRNDLLEFLMDKNVSSGYRKKRFLKQERPDTEEDDDEKGWICS